MPNPDSIDNHILDVINIYKVKHIIDINVPKNIIISTIQLNIFLKFIFIIHIWIVINYNTSCFSYRTLKFQSSPFNSQEE